MNARRRRRAVGSLSAGLTLSRPLAELAGAAVRPCHLEQDSVSFYGTEARALIPEKSRECMVVSQGARQPAAPPARPVQTLASSGLTMRGVFV